MKVTYAQLRAAWPPLRRLNSEKRKPRLAMALANQLALLDPLYERLEKVRRDLVDEHALKDGDAYMYELVDGRREIRLENRHAFDVALTELMDDEVDLDLKPIPEKEFGKKWEISGADLHALLALNAIALKEEKEDDD
jgi:hypothetical protein